MVELADKLSLLFEEVEDVDEVDDEIDGGGEIAGSAVTSCGWKGSPVRSSGHRLEIE